MIYCLQRIVLQSIIHNRRFLHGCARWSELKRLITARFPQAAFVVEEGFDPEGVYLVTTVDIADTDDVIAVVGDRLVEMQVDKGLPVYVTPLRPLERVVAELRKREAPTPPASLPLTGN